MENLPPDVNVEIFVRLPIKSLRPLKRVSKSFKTLITSHHFTHAYRNRTSSAHRVRHLLLVAKTFRTLKVSNPLHARHLRILTNVTNACNKQIPANVRVVGSCHGLVCLRYYEPNTYSFFNPTTDEFRVLPYPRTFPAITHINLCAFGYDSSSDDYKVVIIGTDKNGDGESLIRLYSARVDSWKTVLKQVPFQVLSSVKPVYVNGVIYWLGFGGKRPPIDKITRYAFGNKIIGFDFACEEFKVLSLQSDMIQRGMMALGVLGECLCVLSGRAADAGLDMWVMVESGVAESWIKTFSLQIASPYIHLLPKGYVGDEVLFVADSYSLVLYDPGKRTTKTLDLKLHWDCTPDVAMYEESLVSPYG